MFSFYVRDVLKLIYNFIINYKVRLRVHSQRVIGQTITYYSNSLYHNATLMTILLPTNILLQAYVTSLTFVINGIQINVYTHVAGQVDPQKVPLPQRILEPYVCATLPPAHAATTTTIDARPPHTHLIHRCCSTT